MALKKKFEGLFKGPTENDIYALQKQERDAKIRQAMADSQGAGGNFYANIQAKANEQLSQSVQGVARSMLQGTSLAMPEDPRLSSARKRDIDKTEIIEMLSDYNKDGKISEDELRKGYSELLSRGYPQEAESFLKQAQSMRKLDIDEALVAQRLGASGVKGAQHAFEKITKHRDSKGKILLRSVSKEKTGGKVKFEWTDEAGNVVDAPTGKLESLDEGGQTTAEVQAYRKELIVKRRKEKTTGVQEESDIDAGADTKLKWKDSRQAMIDLGEAAKLEFQDITRAIKLTDKIKTGGGMQMVLKVRQFLGVNSGDAGELASLFRTGVIARLKEMGTKPTDKDLEYLESAVQNLGQDQETNQRILRRMVGRVQQVISRGEYLKANKGMTQEDFNNNGYKARTYQWEGEEGERTPVSPSVPWDSL